MINLLLSVVQIQILKNQMEVQKAIQLFLEKNNLLKTLHTFKKQSKRSNVTSTNNKNLQSQLIGIQKFTLNRSNQHEIRQHLQKTDPIILRRTIQKFKRNRNQVLCKSLSNKHEMNIEKLSSMKFFRNLVEKQNIFDKKNVSDENSVSDIGEASSLVIPLDQSRFFENQWESENQVGYDLYECTVSDFQRTSQQISHMKQFAKNGSKVVQFPTQYYRRYAQKINRVQQNNKDKKRTKLPPKVLFQKQDGQIIYPLEDKQVTYDSFDLKIIYDRQKTGFEQQRDITIVINQVLAGRYQVIAVLGQAQFSKAIQVKDLTNNKYFCIKIIQNNKDYFDQSIDQIKLLRYINSNVNTDQSSLLSFYDCFYHKEHLMLVTQLLKDNLYDARKINPSHFSLKCIQSYSKQILTALSQLHSLHIIHTDLKPENILIKSYTKQQCKVIDIGSSIFFHDRLSFEIQTISYRAPEVILGCVYDHKIDIWSFGCILAQMIIGEVLFEGEHVVEILAKMQGIRGPWPSWMIQNGKLSNKYFTKDLVLYEHVSQNDGSVNNRKNKKQLIRMYVPKHTNLKARLNTQDKVFIDFVSKCLKLDPSVRLSAKQALKHPFFSETYQ